MKLTSNSFVEEQKIPGQFAFGVPDAAHHVALGDNRNPHLAWSEAPAGTQSFVLICLDPDAPSVGDDVNQEGRTVPAALPRTDFFHWVLVDLPADLREIAAGEFSCAVTPRGKPGPQAPHGARRGLNNYTEWFASDNDMRGDYYGYDGPCPPWNDELPHRYIFTLYALDVPRLPLEGRFTGPAVLQALVGHVLAEAHITGRYSLNPALG
ncbi:MAG: YbhB/YbcL family Raf kinase inhibitor-like protein [Zoogloeaceae bacterium]|jgi:Raf kinase inhibitor-like YbhB/YbcL family protein|nr:YbhB/YbcL family Raf kinase inhibitor-like protein [Zoogloeaceae bacterium]